MNQIDILTSFETLRKTGFGARFYKVDLHFHTPASEDARGINKYGFNPYQKKTGGINKTKDMETASAENDKILADARQLAAIIVQRFVEEKLSLVVITDHNAIGTIWLDSETDESIMDLRALTWYEIIDDEAQKINAQAGKPVLTILPGVEISNCGIHLLAIFPAQKPRRAAHFIICDLLNEIGFAIEEWGKNPETGRRSVFDSIELVTQKGGIAIPAHIDGAEQALLELFELTSDNMENILKNEKLFAVEIVKPEKFKIADTKKNITIKNSIDKLRADRNLNSLAFLQGSDAHDLVNIGKRYSFIKMTAPTFNGLFNALKIPSSRVRISDEHQQTENGLFIFGLEIDNNFFGKQVIRFNRHLNCISGKKESGKTYLFNLMQAAVNLTIPIDDGSIRLFMEKIEKKISGYYVFVRDKNNETIELYSINIENKSAERIEDAKAIENFVKPKFYQPGKIDELISVPEKLNEFLIKHFGEATAKNAENFNKIFAIPGFLESQSEQLMRVEIKNNMYELSLNIDYGLGLKNVKFVDFFKLNNSLKRCVMMAVLIIGEQFGPVTIDAPEDYLDNYDVSQFLVPIIKKYKDFQQVNLFSSNPVLSVNSDPENYIILEMETNKIKTVHSGFAIDDYEKKNLAIDIFEGGFKSFKRRKDRYGGM